LPNSTPVNSQDNRREHSAHSGRKETVGSAHTCEPENYAVQTFGLFFAQTRALQVRSSRSEPLEFPVPDQTNPLLERFLQALNGRFLCFAPISSVSPQKSSNIHAIYQLIIAWRRREGRDYFFFLGKKSLSNQPRAKQNTPSMTEAFQSELVFCQKRSKR
jgi:hypothetical protein